MGRLYIIFLYFVYQSAYAHRNSENMAYRNISHPTSRVRIMVLCTANALLIFAVHNQIWDTNTKYFIYSLPISVFCSDFAYLSMLNILLSVILHVRYESYINSRCAIACSACRPVMSGCARSNFERL